MAPVAAHIDVAEDQFVLQAEADAGRCASDLPGDEVGSSPRALVVVQDPAACESPVGLAVVDRHVVRERLRDPVRRAWVEGGELILGGLERLTEHLRAGGLVEAYGSHLASSVGAQRLEEA